MYQQPDTLHHNNIAAEPVVAVQQQEEQLPETHTYEALQQLPANATPAQEDVALRSLYDRQLRNKPVEMDSSLIKDETGWESVTAANDTMPLYYKESFFADSLRSEQTGRMGVAGDPVPYNLRSDSVLSSVVIVSTLIMLFCVKRATKFFSFQIRNFFRVVRNDSSIVKEAASDTRNLLFITFYGCMVLALVFFFYANKYIAETYITYSEYTLMGIFLAEISGFVLCELALQSAVNAVFFTRQQREMWTTTKLFIYSSFGILMMPLMMIVAYFGIETENAILYALIIIIFVKIATFYKAFQIFFGKISASLQFFLYLCTLEIIPPLILWGILLLTANYLKVNID